MGYCAEQEQAAGSAREPENRIKNAMRGTGRTIGVALAALALGIWGGTAAAQKAPVGVNSPAPAARVGDEIITLEEVEQGVKPQLAKLEEQRYEILDQRLDQLIGERLLAQEAKRRSVSVEELLKTEVFAKAPDIPDSEVQAFITQNKGRLPKMDDKELRLKVWDHLRSQKVNEQRQTYVQGLRGQSKVTVLLQEPTSARYNVSGDRGFSRGPKDAPVTIVEFSDFQCPFCKTATTTIKQVLDKYPGKVRLVFRDYPLASIHPQAPKAHEAARCAADQAKFWEYHDVLFERSPKLSVPELKRYAQDLKLDATPFDQCLDSGKYTAEVDKDFQEGASLGITGTPSFFINGKQIVGAQPFAAFQKVVDGELAKVAAKK
jgi:protein-disulfide isomerase